MADPFFLNDIVASRFVQVMSAIIRENTISGWRSPNHIPDGTGQRHLNPRLDGGLETVEGFEASQRTGAFKKGGAKTM